jgi:hypothetical protein
MMAEEGTYQVDRVISRTRVVVICLDTRNYFEMDVEGIELRPGDVFTINNGNIFKR